MQAQNSFDNFSANFVKGYQALHLPDLELSYSNNLQHIQSAGDIQKQFDFFTRIKNELHNYEGIEMKGQQKIDFGIIEYETKINLERIALEQRWVNEKPAVIPTNNLYSIPHGKEWYAYFVKRWTGADVSPDELYLNGMIEVDSVQQHIENIRLQTGLSKDSFYKHLNDVSFFLQNKADVEKAFAQTKATIEKNLHSLFYPHQIPDVAIAQGTNENLAQTPGYYMNDTFFFNYFDKPYNKRQIDWLFIHEAVPGHHYQGSVASVNASPVQQLFWYPGFAEGWAAYTEDLGKELGVYKTIYDELGKWEWDLVRSVRVLIDVGINYYGWSDEKALAFWKEKIPNQDDIAMREINRMKRWPAQVITYKYGSEQIRKWKQQLEQQQGDAFKIKDFHERLLAHGSLPLALAEQNVFYKGKDSL